MTIFGDLLKYWEILGFFHSYTNGTCYVSFVVTLETCHEIAGKDVVPFEKMDSHSLSRVLVIKVR